ncbi:MAG: PDC sensor domain-containing protein [Pseudotabrizicola sp.]|uniref:PDC sensor domain-containing protein n=1 Tax=Pseudotabrizicola sp. TaxID=2939647 RepID=UPI00271F649F|nr:PDC sensor domain-containing protein [Pseudotabrizicola sp.]MDO9640415.1 PDC sensor domain-containing protein [Pseudotabrizicola sp.]
MMRRLATLLCALPVFALPAYALDSGYPEAKAREFVSEALKTWASHPVLISAVQAQNQRHATITQSEIDALDATWMAELGKSLQPTISGVLNTDASKLLRDQVTEAGGQITEVFVMDAVGLNVAASDATSDYWQGDEAKFQQTFPKGPDAIHISDVEFDESSQVFQVQISFPLTDPVDGRVIGAVTVALNAEHL